MQLTNNAIAMIIRDDANNILGDNQISVKNAEGTLGDSSHEYIYSNTMGVLMFKVNIQVPKVTIKNYLAPMVKILDLAYDIKQHPGTQSLDVTVDQKL